MEEGEGDRDEFTEMCKFVVDSGPFDGYSPTEHIIKGKQDTVVTVDSGLRVVNFCSNNYSGLASDDRIVEAANKIMKTHGYGMSSAPLMWGFQDIHKKLEKALAEFHGTDDCLLFPSGYHTNVGVFQACFNDEDAIFSDAENHASIVDGVRLWKAKRFIYRHLDLVHLEEQLKSTQDWRFRCIITEGIFSMDADILDLPKYIALARKYKAVIYLDECHSIGVIGKTGRGWVEYWGCIPNDWHFIWSTLGKAIGGGGGGYVTGRKAIIDFLRQTWRTFIFSNSLCSPIIGASLKALELFNEDPNMFERLRQNALRFRTGMRKNGFYVFGSDDWPICPVLIKDTVLGYIIETTLLKRGYYTIGLIYPIVPKGTGRFRIIVTAKHTHEQIDGLVQEFKNLADELNLFEKIKSIPGPDNNWGKDEPSSEIKAKL